ncbi:hypothetical protein K3495_g10383 [Podosphaera aphanis]|nr:hypothetical protein K3495_g10383 [Podosphaera aphanis]
MLRLPPTVIGLGRSDIQEFERRRKISRWIDTDEPTRKLPNIHIIEDTTSAPAPALALASTPTSAYRSLVQFAKKYPALQQHSLSLSSLGPNNSRNTSGTGSSSYNDRRLTRGIAEEISHHYINSSANFQNTSSSNLSSYNNSQDVEDFLTSNLSQRKSSLDTVRFTDQIFLNYSHSPCYYPSDGASGMSRSTYEDLPHVSRIVNHNSSGILFSQPPKKLTGRPVRVLRHQENSFSLVSSDESFNFEQGRDLPMLTNIIAPEIENTFGLHKQPSNISLQSSQDKSEISVTLQRPGESESSTFQIEEFECACLIALPPSPSLPSATAICA